jgi:hypothetical protein
MSSESGRSPESVSAMDRERTPRAHSRSRSAEGQGTRLIDADCPLVFSVTDPYWKDRW